VAGAALVLFALRVAPGTTGSDWAQAFMLAVLGAILGQLVNRFFARIRTQTSRLQALAGTDPLTGAANRRAWDEELVGSMVRARRNGRPVSLVLLDLDEFKEYNDRNGHQAGDILLKEAASAWQNILRASDILARIGGDEFGILLPGCHLEMAASIAERLRCAYPSAKCSVGVAVWDGSEDKEMLVARTDAALYEAKQRGRGRMVVVPDVGKPAPHTTEPAPYTTELPA
jgi:diguanylate cyclase (GGDEF)-like protein